MKKILLLSTGGTIASTHSSEGLAPTQSGEHLLNYLGTLPYSVDVKDILILDSSNIQPEEWQFIAESVYHMRSGYDGIVVTHGTDTMAYTASMLTFMLPSIDIPVVFTGSQLPITHPLTDALENLRCAFAMASSGCCGIFVAFDRKIMLGCRAVKVRTSRFDAFESVNYALIGDVSSDGLKINHTLLPKMSGKCQLKTQVDNRIALVKLIPGTSPEFFKALKNMGCRGIVIEAFGAGGLHFFRRDLVSALEELVNDGIAVVVCSQCLYERSDMSTYEVGRKALAKGVIPGEDMTTESAITKLMWGLGQGLTSSELVRFFAENLYGEMSIDKD